MTIHDVKIFGDVNKQVLGLTDEHIQYLTNRNSSNQNDKTAQTASTRQMGIHKELLMPFDALKKSAKAADLDIKVASGFRSFERQLLIWNNKFTGITAIKKANGETVDISCLSDWQIIEAILLYSALPGASRHHWGCDIDVYAPNLLAENSSLQLEPWEYQANGPMAKLSDWLTKHAKEFGFYLPYNRYRGGVAEEPWHLSFEPLAKHYQKAFNLKLLEEYLINTNIAGKMTIIENLAEISERYIKNVNSTISR